jgi:hypothetical protein
MSAFGQKRTCGPLPVCVLQSPHLPVEQADVPDEYRGANHKAEQDHSSPRIERNRRGMICALALKEEHQSAKRSRNKKAADEDFA